MPNIEEHIRKAIEEGQFDNLAGKGKPLKFEDNPHENPEWRLAYTMLKNSGFSLPWLEERHEIENEIEQANKTLKRAWQHGKKPGNTQDEWQRVVEAYRLRITELNKRILNYNLNAPSPRFHMRAIRAEQEIQNCSQDQAPGEVR